MAKIKSAWEIALERTKNITVNKEKLKFDDDISKAKAYSGTFINDQDIVLEDTIKKLDTIENKEALREGLKTTIMQNLTLPNEFVVNDRFDRIIAIASYLTKSENVIELVSQIATFLKQYPEHRDQLFTQLKEQFAPMIAQKAEQLRAQYGENINLSPEQDPEFVKLAKQNLEKLQVQYEETLTNAKEQLNTLI